MGSSVEKSCRTCRCCIKCRDHLTDLLSCHFEFAVAYEELGEVAPSKEGKEQEFLKGSSSALHSITFVVSTAK